MAGMGDYLTRIFLILISLCFTEVCGKLCYYSYSYVTAYRRVMYCSYGCCGYYYHRRCCSGGGTIAGSVVGGIAFIAIVVGIVICCVMSHKRGNRGGGLFRFGNRHSTVPMTTGGTTVSVVHSQSITQPPPPHMQTFQYSNPAYPPPPVGPANPAPPGYCQTMPPPYGQSSYPTYPGTNMQYGGYGAPPAM